MKLKSISTVASATVLLVSFMGSFQGYSRDIPVKDIKSTSLTEESKRSDLQRNNSRLNKINTRANAAIHDDTATTRPLKLPGSNTVLCGAMVYNDLWGVVDGNGNYLYPITAGMYTIQAKPNGALKQLNTNENLIKMRAGVKVNSVYYAISTTNYDSEAYLSTYYTNSWAQASNSEIDVVNVPSDMTYDPVSGNVYGFFYNDQTQEYDRFCRFDTYYGEAEQISTVDRNGFAIAANAKGEIYGIWGYTGWLIKIDPKTGVYEQIGRTGFSPSMINSLTFDDATGKLYWSANDATGYSALLEVNTTTGKATEIMHYANNASFAGIFAMPYSIPDNAPSAVTNAKITYTAIGALTGHVTYVAPTLSHNGATLSGPLTIAVSVNGADPIEQTGITPGMEVTTPMITFAEGPVSVEITTADDVNLGESVTITSWAGEDIPGTPANVTLTEVNGRPTLTWDTPTAGKNGGVFDPAGITYTIERTTDKTIYENIKGNSWVDEEFSGNSALSYRVYAVNSKGRSDGALSNQLVFGDGYTIPFVEKFASSDAFNLWTVIDLNGNTTWEYDSKNKNIYYEYGKTVELAGDDWIISPKVRLRAGVTYALTFDASSYYKGYPENFRFMLGREPRPEAMTQTLVDVPDFDSPTGESRRVLFHVDDDGVYYLGLYCYSIAHNWRLTVDNIGMSEVDSSVPGPVAELSVTPAPMGKLSADISCIAPAVDSKGNAMAGTFDIKLFRNDIATPIHVFNDVTPSQTLTWTDNTMTESAVYTYSAAAVNEAGEGDVVRQSAFVGNDIPGAVTDLTVSEGSDGAVTLTWNAPTQGANGGYFDASAVTYRIQRSNDASVVADNLTATSFVDRTLTLTSQTLMYYLVTPYVGDVKGQYNNTPLNGVFGPAYKAPVTETFKGADIALYPWVSESDGPVYTWSLETSSDNPMSSDQNGDGGMVVFVSNQTTRGITGNFASPKISIAGLQKPSLSFWMYHTTPSGADNPTALTLSVKCDNGQFMPVDGASWGRDNNQSGWHRYEVDLSDYADSSWIRLMFTATADGAANVLVDNIAVAEASGIDIEAVDLAGVTRLATGVNAEYVLTVSNSGAKTAHGVKANVKLSGADTASRTLDIGDIEPGSMSKVNIPLAFEKTGLTTVSVTVDAADDTNADNNTASLDVTVVDPVTASPFGLTARIADNKVVLDWQHPFSRGNVSDDFESYKDWAIDNIGQYIMIDRDGDYTYHINMNMDYDNMSSPKAFQVCNAAKLGINIWPEGTPHSGDKMMMAMASASRANDDWMLSPLLNGASQTVSFYAKAFTAQDTPAEHMKVMYSTKNDASPNVADFELCSGGDILVPDQWTLYTFVLPEGTRRFAINCVSEDAFSLFIDDMSYNDMTVPASNVKHYEISRDGNIIATVSDLTHIDTTPVVNKAVYRVRAVYDDGKVSPYSEAVTVDASSVSDIQPDSQVSVIGSNGQLTVTGRYDKDVAVYTVDGRLMATSDDNLTDKFTLSVEPGIYIVKVGNRTYKATVQ